jgi:uroporphyrinogen III methyltransferase / synthase
MPEPGRVYLVGAGPGDPGLMSVRALELIAAADVVLYDRLIPSSALDGARPDAELLFVGKQGGGPAVPQDQTTELIIARAKAGRTVVRLKGGDPFVFGRGGEEALALRAAGIDYEVVPGITAGVAAAAYAGIPVTHRGLATAVAFVTGHTRADGPDANASGASGAHPGQAGADNEGEQAAPATDASEAELDWTGLASFPGTLVFYMSVGRLPEIAAGLTAAGRPAEEPAAVVERGTWPDQRTVIGTLATIAETASAAGVRAPAITVVGAVAGLSGELAWLPDARHAYASPAAQGTRGANAPLEGRTVAVTRARVSASGLAQRLQALGAQVVEAPTIRTVPLPGPAPDLGQYDLLCLTSPVGVDCLFERLRDAGLDARALVGARVAAIGKGTAEALAAHGILADVLPERAVAEGLVDALDGLDPPVRRALIARASEGREMLPDALRARGAEVDVLALYETVADAPPASVIREALTADYVTFTSASTVRFFLRAAGATENDDDGRDPTARAAASATENGRRGLAPSTRLVSIGPITSAALREHGLEPDVEAAEHDVEGLVQALLADAAAQRR